MPIRVINPDLVTQRINVAGQLFEKPKNYEVSEEVATFLDQIRDGDKKVFLYHDPKAGETVVNLVNTTLEGGLIVAKRDVINTVKPDVTTAIETVVEGKPVTYSEDVLAKAQIKGVAPKNLDYSNMKLDELKAEAVNRGLDMHSKVTKAEVTELLINSDKDSTIKQVTLPNKSQDGKIEYEAGNAIVEEVLRDANANNTMKPQDLDDDQVVTI